MRSYHPATLYVKGFLHFLAPKFAPKVAKAGGIHSQGYQSLAVAFSAGSVFVPMTTVPDLDSCFFARACI